MIFNLVDTAGGEDLGTGPVTVTFLYYSTKDGLYKTVEKHCASGGSVTAPTDVGDVASTIGDTSVLFINQHPALTFQGWNQSIPASIAYDITIGAMYVTTDGLTYVSIRIPSGGMNLKLRTEGAGTTTLDWGDGTSNTYTTVGTLNVPKTYTIKGDHWFTIGRDTGTYILGQGAENFQFMDAKIILSVFLGDCTIINNYAFFENTTLTTITIPNSVASIGDHAFHDCFSLTSMTIPSGVTSVGTYAFFSCSSLTSMTIPSGVTLIADRAFCDGSNGDGKDL